MTVAGALLRAKNVGIRNFRDSFSRFIDKHELFIITEHGEPKSVLLPYNDMLELADILDELNDKELLKLVAQGRKAIRRGAKGISVTSSFKKA